MLAQQSHTHEASRTTASSVACVWTDFDDDVAANQWYEDTHIPAVVGQLGITARHAENVEDNNFKEVSGIAGAFLTVFDLPDGQDSRDLEARIRPAADKLPRDAQINSRIYSEHSRWLGREWQGDERGTQMWMASRWQPIEAVHDEFVQWFVDDFGPGIASNPGIIRGRLFKVDNGSSLRDRTYKERTAKSVFQYMALWELSCEELPMEVLVFLGTCERWIHYIETGSLNWQISRYLLSGVYSDRQGEDSLSSRVSITVNGRAIGAPEDSDSDTSTQGSVFGGEDYRHTEMERGTYGATHSETYVSR